MSDLRCPRCGESFRIPDAEIPAGAIARCPWCMEAFPLAQLLSTLAPMAQLTDSKGEPLALAQSPAPLASNPWDEHNAAADGPVAASEFADRADDQPPSIDDSYLLSNKGDDRQADEDDQAWGEPSDSDDSNMQWVPGPPAEPRPLQDVVDMRFGREDQGFVTKPRVKKQSSPMKSVVGIVLGGLLAFPLTAVILALAGRPMDLGFWPFDGKTIATGVSRRTAVPVMPNDTGSQRTTAPPGQGRSLAADLLDDFDMVTAPAESETRSAAGTQTMPRPSAPEWIEPLIEEEPLSEDEGAPPQPDPETSGSEAADAQPSDSGDSPPELGELAVLDEPPISDREDSPATQSPDAAPAADSEDQDVALIEPEIVSEEPPPAKEAVAEVTPTPQPPGNSTELQAALTAADEAIEAVENYHDEEGPAGLKRRLATLYASVAAVGEIAKPGDEAALIELIDRLAANHLIKELAPAAPNWAKYSKRPNDGMLVVGPLRRQNDKWFLDWTGSMPLEIRSIDESTMEDTTRVLVLGRLIASETAPAVETTFLKPIDH